MIYTIGNREVYDPGIAEKEAAGERFMKRGMGQIDGAIYRGGAVFDTPEKAQEWIAAQLADAQARVDTKPTTIAAGQDLELAQKLTVYGVEADWDRDTMEYPGEEFRRLLVNRPLVKLP